MKKLSTALVLMLSMFIISCGDDKKSDGDDQAVGLKLKGVVVDPYIRDSRVSLIKKGETVTARVCGSSGNLPCEGWSNEIGEWQISINIGMNLDDFYLNAIGGIDTKYGIAFDNIPLRRSKFALNNKIVISPITTVLHDYSSDTNDSAKAESTVKKALGLDDSIDLYADPMDNISLLKESYMIVKTAILLNEKGGSNSIDVIATNIGSNENIFSNDKYLGAILVGVDNATSREEIKASKVSLDATIGEINDVVAKIAKTEKLVYFKEAIVNGLQNYPTDPADPTADFATNVEQLYDRVEIVMESNLSVIQTNINQIVRLLKATQETDELDDYVNFNVTESEFQEKLVTYVPDTLKARLVGVSTDSVISVDIPYFEVLGDDNAKRSSYYFNSTADNTYKARQLISDVNSDAINDTIYTQVIIANTKYGLHEKAANFADIYMIDSLNRADAYRLIGAYSSSYNKVKAIEYLDESKRLLDAIYKVTPPPSGNTLTSIAMVYQMLATEYGRADAVDKGSAIRNFLINDLLGALDSSSSPSVATLYGRLIFGIENAIGGVMSDLVANKEYENAERLAVDYNELITNLQPGAVNGKRYATHLIAYEVLMEVYFKIVQQKEKDNVSSAELIKYKNLILAAYDSALEKKDIDASDGGTTWKNSFAGMMAPVGWSKGASYINDTFLPMIGKITGAYKYNSYLGYLSLVGEFNTVKTFIESKVAMGSAFENISDYVEIITYYNDYNKGISLNAFEYGNNPIAKEYLVYLVTQLDKAVTYFNQQDVKPLKLGELITDSSERVASRYSHQGYLRVADIYALFDKTEAKKVLAKATSYVATTPDSFLKSKAYAVIGKMYHDIGETINAESHFTKAAGVSIPSDTASVSYAFYIGLAHDEFIMNNEDKTTKMNEYLGKAILEIDKMPNGTDTEKEARVDNLRYVAAEYANIPDLAKADEIFKRATTEAQAISSTNKRKTALIEVMDGYVSIGLVDRAGIMANDTTIMTTEADKYTALESIAEAVVNMDVFKGTDIAISDTDKDGKPDFFAPWATAEQITASGLTLDDDIDGDGVLDSTDLRPFFKDN